MNPFTRLSGVFLSILLCAAGHSALAQRAFYIPKSLIMPVHTHKGELHVSLGRGGGYDANVSYAFANHFAAFATGTVKPSETEGLFDLFPSNYEITRDEYAFKGGVGVFKSTRSRVVHQLESYVGAGTYSASNYIFNTERPAWDRKYTRARFWNVFGQFNASSRFGRAELTAAVRLAYSRYTHLQTRDAAKGDETLGYENLGFFTVDPVLSQSLVFGRFKMSMQYGLSLLLKDAVATEVRTRPAPGGPLITAEEKPITHLMGAVLFRVGLQYNFDLRKNQK